MPANSSATNTALGRLSYDVRNQTGQFAPDVVAANRARMDAATKARADSLATERAAGKAAQAAENERLSLLEIPDAAEYWDDTQASLGWENPYPKDLERFQASMNALTTRFQALVLRVAVIML